MKREEHGQREESRDRIGLGFLKLLRRVINASLILNMSSSLN